ncbi:hypothetical protein CsSME_00053562 [Camellia sinensis var. sinensis]
MATASCACKCSLGPLLSTGHEFPAPIHGIPSDVRCMVFLTLCVTHSPNNRSTAPFARCIPSYDTLLHTSATLILCYVGRIPFCDEEAAKFFDQFTDPKLEAVIKYGVESLKEKRQL